MEKKEQLMSFCMGASKILAVLFFLCIGMNQANAQNYLPEGQALANLSAEAVNLNNQMNSATPGSSTYYQLERKVYLYKMVADQMFEPGQSTESASENGLRQFRPALKDSSAPQQGTGNLIDFNNDREQAGSTPNANIPVATGTEYQDLEDSLMQLVSN